MEVTRSHLEPLEPIMADTNRIKLTNGRVNAFLCPTGIDQAFLWDTEIRGLAVRATKSGSRAYIFQAKHQGSTLRITIGDASVWGLADARTEASRLKMSLDQGIDPREVVKEKARARIAAEEVIESRKRYTLEALCTAYVDYLKGNGKVKSSRDTKSIFKVHVLEEHPALAALPVKDVTSHHIAAIIRKVRESGKERTAGILRNYLTAAFNAARRAPFDSAMPSTLIAFEITNNPAEAVPTIPVNRGNRVLTVNELKTYMASLGDDNAGLALQVAILGGGQRLAQLLRAKVSDFDQDTNTLRLWDTKGKRTHAREHLVPLAPKAAGIVRTLIGRAETTDSLLFKIGEQSCGNKVAEIAKNCSSPYTLRDLRRTVETQLATMGIHKDTRAQLLSHGISGVQAAHYDRYEYFNEKSNALIAWEQRLEDISNGTKRNNVVALGHAA